MVLHIISGKYERCTASGVPCSPIVAFRSEYTAQGLQQHGKKHPEIIRLFENEEPPKTLSGRLRFFADELDRYGWDEKYSSEK